MTNPLLPRQVNDDGIYGLEWLPIHTAPMGFPLLVYHSAWHGGYGASAFGMKSSEGWVIRGLLFDTDVMAEPEAWSPMPPHPSQPLVKRDSYLYGGQIAS
jgi:hypothetical protein